MDKENGASAVMSPPTVVRMLNAYFHQSRMNESILFGDKVQTLPSFQKRTTIAASMHVSKKEQFYNHVSDRKWPQVWTKLLFHVHL